jgi:ABC-type multidrug transport system ATPase subunit
VLPDIESVCDDVIVMDKGRVAAHGPIAVLKQPQGRVYELRFKAPAEGAGERFLDAVRAAGLDCDPADDEIVRVFVPGDGADEVFRIAVAAGVQIRHLRPSVPTLEDVFARAVGEA